MCNFVLCWLFHVDSAQRSFIHLTYWIFLSLLFACGSLYSSLQRVCFGIIYKGLRTASRFGGLFAANVKKKASLKPLIARLWNLFFMVTHPPRFPHPVVTQMTRFCTLSSCCGLVFDAEHYGVDPNSMCGHRLCLSRTALPSVPHVVPLSFLRFLTFDRFLFAALLMCFFHVRLPWNVTPTFVNN